MASMAHLQQTQGTAMKIATAISATTLALLGANPAHAVTVTDWGPHNTPTELGIRLVYGPGTVFTDVFTFTLSSTKTAVATATEGGIVEGVVDITGGKVELFSGKYGDGLADTSKGQFSFDGPASSSHAFSNLAAGNYYYLVTGTGAAFGGAYALASTLPVPEPESLALTLAGLGLLGAMARRRKIS